MKKKIFNIAVFIVSSAMLLYFFLYKNGLTQLISVIKIINTMWLLVAIVLMLIYWIFETLIIHELTRILFSERKFRKSIKAAMVGQLFGAITPLQTGAQPAIFYALVENSIDAGSASSILMMKFIIHQTILTVYSFIIIVLKFNYFKSMVSYLSYLCLFGFVFNLAIILVAVMFSVNEKITRSLLLGILKFLKKIKLVNGVERYKDKIEKSLNDFHNNAALIAKNYKAIIKVAIINTIQLTVFYIIPYCIYRSFNLQSASLWNMLAAQTLVMTIVSITPLPGGIGGAEGGFALLFKAFFKENIFPAIVLWRIITFYSCIGIGVLFSIHLPKNTIKDDEIF
ncbi:lysylphosphatidylglycerol synthase transmembrane domain-containing protein [Clostridium tagluense]|uniref:lysylphosphatidylglycerol synthase transmembrane domain-containing protein n=1 Tax=Clostridium tagluense TaxID=360422 RepID=UPI001C6F49B8|nr:lysylphosphatidylglycerol synthase transmembrane domain-containing protein [Clostridium tagluense]MBW9158558.1 flippase-like domain-containing protein [Clostridium tagluense]WLC63707.1 flippase-like domain-containing protein [Clostridium tagluense]